MKDKLIEVRQWAQDQIQGGNEPPWAWYQYMKLVETTDAILAAMASTTTGDSPPSDERSGTHLQLVGSEHPQDSAQQHPAGLPVRLPM